MKIALYDTRTGRILETRRSSAGSVPPLAEHQAWRVVPDACHPDTHRTDPMGLTCEERPDMPVTIAEQDGEVVIDGIPDGADLIFDGKRCRGGRCHRGKRREGRQQQVFIDAWPYKPVLRFVGERRSRAEAAEARRMKIRQALQKVKDPDLRADLDALFTAALEE
jgi:hypothetical protein